MGSVDESNEDVYSVLPLAADAVQPGVLNFAVEFGNTQAKSLELRRRESLEGQQLERRLGYRGHPCHRIGWVGQVLIARVDIHALSLRHRWCLAGVADGGCARQTSATFPALSALPPAQPVGMARPMIESAPVREKEGFRRDEPGAVGTAGRPVCLLTPSVRRLPPKVGRRCVPVIPSAS